MKLTSSRRRTAALVLFALLLLALLPLLSWGQAPTAPTSLFIHSTDAQMGDASPATGIDLTPVFSATFNDADAGALGKKIKIQVSSDQTFAVVSHWNSGQIAITDVANGARCQNVDYNGQALSGLTTYFWRCKFWDETDAAGDWSAAATFTTGPTPFAPTTLFVDSTDASTEASGNPVVEIDQSPVFTAIFTHQNTAAIANKAKIQVSTDSTFATVTHWNSGQLTIANTAHNARTPNIAYNGQYLQGDTVYYWRIRLYDELGNVSPWSTETASFRTILVPSAPTSLQVGSIEAQTGTSGNPVTNIDLTPVFSAVVNHPTATMPATQVRIQVSTDSTFATVTHWKSGKINITPTLPSSRCPDVAYNGQPLSGQTTYYWRTRFFASDGGVSEWSTEAASFTTQAAPLSPTTLFVGSSEAQSGTQGDPVNLIDLNPTFSAIFQHQNTGIAGTKIRVQVSTDSTFADVTHWNSGQLAIANVANGARSADVSYNGQLLHGNTRYFWRMRFYDANDNPGPWSTEAASFITILAPTEPTELFVGSDNAQGGASGNPVTGIDLTPVFSARMHHQDVAGIGKKIKVQVTTDPTFTNITHWNSAQLAIANVADGARSQDVAYAGSPLSNSTTYYWRCRFHDAYPSTGPWSVEAASFTTVGAGTPEPAMLSTPNLLQGGVYSNVTVIKSGGTAFASGDSFELVSGGISVSGVQVQDANTLLVSFSVEELSIAGNRTFQVRSGGDVIASGPAYVYYPSQRVPARRNGIAQEPLLNPALVSAGVVASTGEFLFEAQDLLLPGRMLPLGFGRNYRSFLEFDGTMGQSWASVIDDQLRYDSTADSISYFSADGRLHTLTLAASGTAGSGPYVETGSYVEWSRNNQGDSDPLNDVYTALGAHGDNATYVASNLDTEGRQVYRLISMADRLNNTVLLVRDALGRVTEIRGDLYLATEPTRHRLILDYGLDGRLKSIEDFADYTGEPADIVGSFTGPRTWNFVYDTKGRLAQVLLPKTKDWFEDEISSLSARARMLYEYTDAANPNLITDVHSPKQVALFHFDGSGRSWLKNTSDAQGRVAAQDVGRSSAVDTTHRFHIVYGSGTCDVVDPLGRRVRATLTVSGRIQASATFTGFFNSNLSQTAPKLRSADPDTFITSYEFNSQGEVTRVTMPRGNVSVWFYDEANASQRAKGNLLRMAQLPGTADTQGLPPIPAGQQNGILTTFTYSTDFHLLTTSVDPRAYDLEANYDIALPGQLARNDAAEFTTTRVYDAQGRLIRVEAPVISEAVSPLSPNVGQQFKLEFQYNSFGQVTQQADISIYPSPEVGLVTTFEYESSGFDRGRLVRSRAAPTGSDFKNTLTYDSLGLPREASDNAGATTTVFRDQHERVRRTLGPALAHLNGHRYRVDRSFDREGNPLFQTIFDPILDANGSISGSAPREVTTSWVVDILGNVVNVIDEPQPSQFRTSTLVYDAAFQVVEARTPGGVKSATQFDERGLVFKSFSGLLATETDLQQAITIRSFAYNANGALVSATDGRGFTRTTLFDPFDRAVSSSDARVPTPTTVVSVYDHAGNPVEITVSGKKSASSAGVLRQSKGYFDNVGRTFRTGQLAVKNDGTTALGYANETGNDTPGWAMETFSFLPDGRLASSVRDLLDAATPALSAQDVVLGYDDLGRLVRQADRANNLATWGYDLAGNASQMDDYRLDQDSATQTHLTRHATYDELGRVISQSLDGEQPTIMRYNAASLLAFNAPPERGKVQNFYDGAWRLTGSTESAANVWTISTGNGSVNQTGSQSLTSVYAYDADDNLIRTIDNGGNQTLRLYDVAGRHVRTTFPDGTTFTVGATAAPGSVIAGDAYVAATGGYDSEGNVLSVFDEGGNHIVRTFDEVGGLLTVNVTPTASSPTLVGEVAAEYEYDGLGRVLYAENTDRFNHVITRNHLWNTLSRLESSTVVELATHTRENVVDELGRTAAFTQNGVTTTHTFDLLDRVIGTVVSANSQTLFSGGMSYFGRLETASAMANSDTEDIVHQRDGRGRIVKTLFRDRASDQPTRTRSFEYCSQCGMLFASIDDWRTDPADPDRVLGTRFYKDGMGRNTGAAFQASFPDSGSNRFANTTFTTDTRAHALEFDAMDMPRRRSLFVGSGGLSTSSQGIAETPHTVNYGSTGSPLAVGQGSDFVPDAIGNVDIEREVASGPNVTDDGVFTYRYDHHGRLVDITRKSDDTVIEERRYDAIGIEGERLLQDMPIERTDFSTGDTAHVFYTRDDVNLDGGGVKFDSATETGAANLNFPGNLHWSQGFDGPEEVRASYHDFLIDGSALSNHLCTLHFTALNSGYKIKIEVDQNQIRLYDRKFDTDVNYTLFDTINQNLPSGEVALGVRIDLGNGGFGDDVNVKLFVGGTQLSNFTRDAGSQRFAPRLLQFETNGNGARLYRYHGYLGAAGSQGSIPVSLARPFDEFMRRALCSVPVPQGALDVLKRSQAARLQLEEIQKKMAESINNFALARGLDESAFMALLGPGCEGDAFNRGYARQLWALASRIQSAINRLSDSEMEFKAAKRQISDTTDIIENYSAFAPIPDSGGFTLTNVSYTCDPYTGRGVPPVFTNTFHVNAAGSVSIIGIQPNVGFTSYWVRIEGAGYYTFTGSMYCDADTVAGYYWSAQSGPPNYQLLTNGEAIQRAQTRYEAALGDLEGVLDDVGKILPQWSQEAQSNLDFTKFLNEVLEDPNIGAAIFATTKLGKVMSYYGKSTAGRYATNLALMGYGSWLTLEKLGKGIENLEWNDYLLGVDKDPWRLVPIYAGYQVASGVVVGVADMFERYSVSVDDIIFGSFEGDDARVVGGLINHGPAAAETLLFLATLQGPKSGPKGWCFTAGTLVAVENGFKSIEDIEVGNRVLTIDDSENETEIDETWLTITATALNPDGSGDVLEFKRLCSPQWVAAHDCKEGASVHVELEELKFSGFITITSMTPCPCIELGKGRVVTMTVSHLNGYVWEIEVAAKDASGCLFTDILCPTDVHKLYSAERNAWVMAKDLRVGEVLYTQSGLATVTSAKQKPGVHRVYNLEVEKTHQYFVGRNRVLSHNVECPASGPKGPAGYLPHPLEKANFAQLGYGEKFGAKGLFAGQTIDDIVSKLKSGKMKPSDVPIDYIYRDGALILNTRSAQALIRAEIPRAQWTVVNRTGDPFFEKLLNNQLAKDSLPQCGTPTTTPRGK